MLRSGMLAIAIALALVCACTTVSNDRASDPGQALSEPVFRCNVEPVLIRQCSYTACHGIAGTALRVFSPGKLRAVVPKTLDEAIAPLSETEHHANFESAAAFSFETPIADNALVHKPLAQAAGGFAHLGGAIFTTTQDAQYAAIAKWLAGEGVCQ